MWGAKGEDLFMGGRQVEEKGLSSGGYGGIGIFCHLTNESCLIHTLLSYYSYT